jgi:glucose-6-phosphate isomerase
MKEIIQPFSIAFDPNLFSSFESGRVTERHLSHLEDYFSDQKALSEILSRQNPLVYKVWEMEYEGEGRGISIGMTIISPGRVGDEYFMTRGHFHEADSGDEIYIATGGTGGVLLADRSGDCQFLEMHPGNLYYVPGNFSHRTINIGTEDFMILSIWPPHIVHDYGTISSSGFPKLVMSSNNGYKIVDNPKFSLR